MIKTKNNKVEVDDIPNGYIKNPVSGKIIKVGGKLYNQMLKNQEVDQTSKIVAECKSHNEAKIKKSKLQFEQPLPDNKVYSIGNDRKKVLVKQKKSQNLKLPDMTKMISVAVDRVHKKLQNQYENVAEIEEDESSIQMFQQMIEQELILMQHEKTQKSKSKAPPQPIQEVQQGESESEYTDSD